MKYKSQKKTAKPGFKEQDKSLDLCWGRNSVISMLEAAPEGCFKIYLASGCQRDFKENIRALGAKSAIKIEETDGAFLEKLTGTDKHQGVAAFLKIPEPLSLSELPDTHGPSLLVIADHIQDPHNFGAIIRSAEVVGALGVVFPDKRASQINGTVIKTSAGGAFRTNLFKVTNLVRALEELKKKGYWTIGLDHRSSKTIWEETLPDRLALVVGSEGKGISRLLGESCDEVRKIPMAGRTGSLNASVAGAIAMFEWRRLQGKA